MRAVKHVESRSMLFFHPMPILMFRSHSPLSTNNYQLNNKSFVVFFSARNERKITFLASGEWGFMGNVSIITEQIDIFRHCFYMKHSLSKVTKVEWVCKVKCNQINTGEKLRKDYCELKKLYQRFRKTLKAWKTSRNFESLKGELWKVQKLSETSKDVRNFERFQKLWEYKVF